MEAEVRIACAQNRADAVGDLPQRRKIDANDIEPLGVAMLPLEEVEVRLDEISRAD